MTTHTRTPTSTRRLLTRLIEAPGLVEQVQKLPPSTFSALVRGIGLEDAGEIVALATTEQLVTAFDEDLFVNERAGERESFDPVRFVVWLEVLLEAGDELAAERVATLGEDFLAHAISSLALVLDYEALLTRMSEVGEDVHGVEKGLENCFVEELDGYLLVSKGAEGWDALWTLIVALDGGHRSFLVRVLDLAVNASSDYLEDLGELASVLRAAESLAEDVEAAREERRAQLGYVEPREAKSFLSLARGALPADSNATGRDPVTRAYFRNLKPAPTASAPATEALGFHGVSEAVAKLPAAQAHGGAGGELPLRVALRLLAERDPAALARRMDELCYLANVILAGAENEGRRFGLAEAGEAALATVALGAELEATKSRPLARPSSSHELADVLSSCPADLLFRVASARLASHSTTFSQLGFLRSRDEFVRALHELAPRTVNRPPIPVTQPANLG